MNGWTKKRKVDTFMGILLQVYCFFPWMRINRKWNTIHMYVYIFADVNIPDFASEYRIV